MAHRIEIMASVIFALIFLGIMSMMYGTVNRYGSEVNRKVGNTVSVAENYELLAFDGTKVTGDTVISAINNRNSLSSKLTLRITVDGREVPGDYASFGETINPSTIYNATLEKNANDVIETIAFTTA